MRFDDRDIGWLPSVLADAAAQEIMPRFRRLGAARRAPEDIGRRSGHRSRRQCRARDHRGDRRALSRRADRRRGGARGRPRLAVAAWRGRSRLRHRSGRRHLQFRLRRAAVRRDARRRPRRRDGRRHHPRSDRQGFPDRRCAAAGSHITGRRRRHGRRSRCALPVPMSGNDRRGIMAIPARSRNARGWRGTTPNACRRSAIAALRTNIASSPAATRISPSTPS